MKNERFKKQLKEILPEVLEDLISDGRVCIVKTNLIEDKNTNFVIRIKPGWNRPVKKGK